MAKQQEVNITEVGSVMHTDSDPQRQPRGTHRFALNAVIETIDGRSKRLTNELSNIATTVIPNGFVPLGSRYIENDLSVVIIVNPDTGYEEIGIIDRNSKYSTLVDTKVLGLSVANQCQIIYRLRRGNERVIYWVDGLNRARTLNLDRLHNFYNEGYKNYLRSGGNPATYTGEKWDASSFDLIKTYKTLPFFSDVKVIETGSILAGSYNFAIQYVDEDLNPTEWITTSNPVRIYNDTASNAFERIRGSKNIDTIAQSFDRASKSIKLTITNLDKGFPYYRVAIIRTAGLNGLPDKVLASDLYSTSDSNFTYTGNDAQLTEVNLADILIDKEIIYSPKHIEQEENRLLLAHGKGKGINWCDFQKFASKIEADLVTKEVALNNALSESNIKNPKSTFLYKGYMPGEVYSFGIAYLFNDGYISPVFHTVGRSETHPTSKMKFYEGDSRYLDIHNCSTDNYWGRDAEGNTLVAKKIRHHRFPFRKEVGKPLVTSTATATNVNKYRLKIVVSLAAGKTYPLDAAQDPIPIEYSFNYQVTGAASTVKYTNTITDTDMGDAIYVYDDVTQLSNTFAGQYAQLDAGSELNTYQTVGNETFVINISYETYVASTSFNDDKAEIFGIKFSNIERPHPDVVGFYIVRNERTEDDKIIVDNAVMGAMTEFQQYKSFGLVTPKQFYPANNCGVTNHAGKTINYFSKGVWFFNPEFQFFNKKTAFDSIEVEGVYNEVSSSTPTISNREGFSCNNQDGGTKGVYINDVQAGTSYDPEINKKKNRDDDGFDLVIGYRNTNFSYAINNTLVFPTKRLVLNLNAASYHNLANETFYNISVDNKISQYITEDDLSTELKETLHNTTSNKNNLVYGALVKNNTTAYSNFITRPYYKEHNNPIYFPSNGNVVNNVSVFNGDAEISALHLVSSVFYDIVVADRKKKSQVWKIVVGALLVVAGVAAAIITAGAATPLAVAAISYGVSLAASGIKFEQFKSMIDTDYEKGLKETVVDGGVYECVRDNIDRGDDTIRWFSDRASNIYIESSVPFGLRSGLTSGVSDFIDAPAPYNEEVFRGYLTEKFTILDRDQGQGRLYKGYAGAEYYDVNKDYIKFNKEKVFTHLPLEYDCCADKNEVFPMRWWWSEQSFQEEKIDNYRTFLPNNYKDIEGEHGEITNIYRLGNNLFIHTKEALFQVPANRQERITGEVVSFIGTGELYSIPPRKVIDDNLGSGGSQHKWATVKTQFGVAFVDEIKSKIYLHAEGIKDLTIGNQSWFKSRLKSFLTEQLSSKFGLEYLYTNNPSNPYGVGYVATYDKKLERLLFTKRDFAILQDKIIQLVASPTVPTGGNDFVYCTSNGRFYQGTTALELSNPAYFENKGFTLSYYFQEDGFVSQHSYLPSFYLATQNNLYSFNQKDSGIYKHHFNKTVQTFYGKYAPFIIEYVLFSSPLEEKTLEDLSIETEARIWDEESGYLVDATYVTFNKVTIFNSKQSTGEWIMRAKDAQANPQDWFAQQTVNTEGTLLIERAERSWNINDIRDCVIDYTKPLFTSNWSVIKDSFPIDKVVNNQVISFKKNWDELQVLRDKYAIIRLKFDNFNNIILTFKHSVDTEPYSG